MAHLKDVASTFNIAIVLINEMSANFYKTDPPNADSLVCQKIQQFNEEKEWDTSNIPALGQTLSVCVNTRILFERNRYNNGRTMHMMFSPLCSKKCIKFHIDDSGLHGFSE